MWKLFSSQTSDFGNTSSTINRQKKEIKNIWDGKGYHNFGIERIVMLSLAILPFTDIALYLRNIFSGEGKLICRKLFVDGYVVFNVIFPLIVLYFDWYIYCWIVILCIYFGVETLIALLSMTFLSRNIPQAISYNRNLLSLFLNFIQMVLLFAVIYQSMSGCAFQGAESLSSLQAIYLSLETFTSVGFGDIVPCSHTGYIVLISQMIVQLLFVYFFFSIFTSKIGNNTFYNESKTKDGTNGTK